MDTDSTLDAIVLECINKSSPTSYSKIVERIEKRCRCEIIGLQGIQEAGKRLVASGTVRIVRNREGKILGVQRT